MNQAVLHDKDWEDAKTLITLGLKEDLNDHGDLTTKAMISPTQHGQVGIVCRKAGIICGLPLISEIFNQMQSTAKFTAFMQDGCFVSPQQAVGYVSGPMQDLLIAERTCLNFLTHLSGIATLTSHYVELTKGTKASILDTRKTHPGYRRLEKYAVRTGGGENHRMGLYDAMMIKDNHREAWQADIKHRPLHEAIIKIKELHPAVMLIVEVDTLEQFKEVLNTRPDVVLLDNMPIPHLRLAVNLRNQENSEVLLEASGGVNLQTVREIAETGVDRISIGALTHSAQALDIAFDWSYSK